MKASYRWLRALLPGLDASPSQVAEQLTAIGLEVEKEERFGEGLEPVLVTEVRSIEPHPSRSGLRLVTVDRGGATQKVVCGAPNVPDPGGLVVLAPLGTHLPAKNMTIEPRAIGGVTSEGMLCSETELGIGDASGGIIVLPAGSAKAGQKLVDALPSVSDVLYEINLTPNRPDALGHVGIARDLAAKLKMPFTPPKAEPIGGAASDVRVTIDDEAADRCPHYGAAIVEGVTIGPSPLWVQHRLFSLGVRPLSNVVDVTNLLLLEFGQPMHAFDLEKIRGGVVRVRLAKDGEQLETLDGKKRSLVRDDLLIADAEGGLALAGVMGGATSEISSGTTRVLLECAYFDPRGIRRASRRHGLHTESSHRFERGVDRLAVRNVLARAARLIVELAGGALKGELHVEPRKHVPVEATLRAERLDALLGTHVDFGEARGIVERIGCATKTASDAAVTVALPSWRPDLAEKNPVAREAALIEEVARMRGYETIPTVLPPIVPQAPRGTGAMESAVRRAAVELGLSEAVTYAFVAPRELEALGAPPAAVRIENPLTEERSVLRTSILPGLLEAIGRARRHGERSARLFAMGRIFSRAEGGSLPVEGRRIGVALAGPRPAWLAKPEDHDVFDAKGIAEELVRRATRHEPSVARLEEAERPHHLHPRGAAKVVAGGRVVGRFGPLHPDVVDALDLGGPVMVVELDVDALDRVGVTIPVAHGVPRLPAVSRDVALVVHDDVLAGSIEAMIREAAGELCEEVELFDLFRGGSIPADHRSLAFHVVYRDPKARRGEEGGRTLTDAEVDQRHQAVVSAVRERLGAVLRA